MPRSRYLGSQIKSLLKSLPDTTGKLRSLGAANTVQITFSYGLGKGCLHGCGKLALLKSVMIGSKAPNHPALFSSQESATPESSSSTKFKQYSDVSIL